MQAVVFFRAVLLIGSQTFMREPWGQTLVRHGILVAGPSFVNDVPNET